MIINKKTGLISPATLCMSPNQDERPDQKVDLIVIHGISLPPAQFGGDSIERFFQNKLDCTEHEYFEKIEGMKVSSHLLIKRGGELVQFVPFHKRAWHAGESSYQGRTACNDFSIGVELEGTNDLAYEEIQYETLCNVVHTLCDTYPGLDCDKITGHCHIAPDRKTDPGPSFNWAHIRGLIESELYEEIT